MDQQFCFRIRFRMSERSLLDLPDQTYELAEEGVRRVWLASVDAEKPLREALDIVIRGEGFDSEDEARQKGEQWRDTVSRALARLHLAADFGDRQPFGQLTDAGRAYWAERLGFPVLADVPGVAAFPCDPSLRFLHSEAKGCRRPSPEQSQAVLIAAAESDTLFSPVERLAFDLYSGSFFQPSADARLLMLTMAVETLLDLQPRSDAARTHVRFLIDVTDSAALTRAERDSLKGSLQWLYDESIGQAGRRLARTLEPRSYGGLRPSAFFTRCYEVRSELVHGYVPRPDRNDVDRLAADLEVFVGHLLSGDLLDKIAD